MEALKISAAASGDSIDSYKEQLKTTYLFADPKAAAEFTTGGVLKQKMELVRQFCFKHGLLDNNIKSVDDVGIAYPDGSIQGRKDHLQRLFDPAFMQAAQQGQVYTRF